MMDLYCCWLLSCKLCPEMPSFTCACLRSSRRCSQLQHRIARWHILAGSYRELQ